VLNVDGIYVARTKSQAENLLTRRIALVKSSIRDRVIELEDLTTKDTVYLVFLSAARDKLSWCVSLLHCPNYSRTSVVNHTHSHRLDAIHVEAESAVVLKSSTQVGFISLTPPSFLTHRFCSLTSGDFFGSLAGANIVNSLLEKVFCVNEEPCALPYHAPTVVSPELAVGEMNATKEKISALEAEIKRLRSIQETARVTAEARLVDANADLADADAAVLRSIVSTLNGKCHLPPTTDRALDASSPISDAAGNTDGDAQQRGDSAIGPDTDADHDADNLVEEAEAETETEDRGANLDAQIDHAREADVDGVLGNNNDDAEEFVQHDGDGDDDDAYADGINTDAACASYNGTADAGITASAGVGDALGVGNSAHDGAEDDATTKGAVKNVIAAGQLCAGAASGGDTLDNGRVRKQNVIYNAKADPERSQELVPKRKLLHQPMTCERAVCLICTKVDTELKIKCKGCYSMMHTACWSPVCKTSLDHTDDWFCLRCRASPEVMSQGNKVDTPCLVCGVRDDVGPIVRCDNCDGNHHKSGLNDQAIHRYDVADANADTDNWYCDVCEPRREVNTRGKLLPNLLTHLTSFIPEVIEQPISAEPSAIDADKITGDEYDDSDNAITRKPLTASAPACKHDPLIADHLRAAITHPTLESFLSDGRMVIGLRIPQLPGVLYEVIKLVDTGMISGVIALTQSDIYVYTGEVIEICSLVRSLHDNTPNKRVHVGHLLGWRVPDGCQAIVPAQFDKATMTMKQLPSFLSRDAYVESEKHQGGTFNMCDAFTGVGGFIDGIRRAGVLNRAFGIDSDAEVLKFARQYTPDDNVDFFLGEIGSLLGTAYVPRGSDAEQLLEKLSTVKMDLVTGGSPCIGFTQINQRRDGADAAQKRSLTMLWGMLVVLLSPRYAILENVEELATPAFSAHLGALLSLLWFNGYQSRMYIVKSAAFGAASNRKRFILVVSKIGTPLPPPPRPTHKCQDAGVAWALVPGKPCVWTDDQLKTFKLKPQVTVGKVLQTTKGVQEHAARQACTPGPLHASRIDSEWVTAILHKLPVEKSWRPHLEKDDTRAFEDISEDVVNSLSGLVGSKDRFEKRSFPSPADQKKWLSIRRSVCKRLDPSKAAPSFTTCFDPFGFMGNNVHPTAPRVVTPFEAFMFAAFDKKRLLQVENVKLTTGYLGAANAICPLLVAGVGRTLVTSYEDREAADFGVR
jgi:DNA (cytosine-5)-methyltransferase 1